RSSDLLISRVGSLKKREVIPATLVTNDLLDATRVCEPTIRALPLRDSRAFVAWLWLDRTTLVSTRNGRRRDRDRPCGKASPATKRLARRASRHLRGRRSAAARATERERLLAS